MKVDFINMIVCYLSSDLEYVHRQTWLKSFDKINFTFNDFQKVLNNNRIFAANGDEAILLSLKYNPIEETATGTFKVKTIYLTNLKETKLIPDGK